MKIKLVIAILLFSLPTVAKNKDSVPSYTVNCDNPHAYACTQYLRLELKQQKVMQDYATYQASFAALNAEAETIKKENGWPENLQFRGDTLTFNVPPPTPEAKKP